MTKEISINIQTGNVVERDLTTEELNQLKTKHNEMVSANETAKQADATNKASGNKKLLDLGLTQAEATALTGYTPPVEE